MTDTLIAQLRDAYPKFIAFTDIPHMASEAADRIEALQAEIAADERNLEQLSDEVHQLRAEIEWITKANIEHVAARVELRAEVALNNEEFAAKLEVVNENRGYAAKIESLIEQRDELQSRLTAIEGQEPLAWIVYAKDSRRYFTLTFDVNKVPEIYVGGEALPLFLAAGAAPTVGLPFVPWSKEAEMRESWVAPQQAEPKDQT